MNLSTLAIPFKIALEGSETMINQPLIVNGQPIGVIKEVDNDWVSGYIFGRYITIEEDSNFYCKLGISISNLEQIR